MNKFAVENNIETPQDGLLLLADARKMTQWLLQVAEQFVAPDPVFNGIYMCRIEQKNILNIVSRKQLAEWLSTGNMAFGEELHKLEQVAQLDPATKLRFFKLLFSMGARLSAMVERMAGNAELQQHPLRPLLEAFNCIGGDDSEERQ